MNAINNRQKDNKLIIGGSWLSPYFPIQTSEKCCHLRGTTHLQPSKHKSIGIWWRYNHEIDALNSHEEIH